MAGFALLSLQENDSAIDRLISRRTALESGDALSGVREKADSAERGFGELKLRLDVMARDQQRFEHEIDSITQKIGSEEKRLFDGSIANVKELESIQHEVSNLKKRRSDREDELLALLEQKEELDIQAGVAEAGHQELRSKIDETSEAAGFELEQIASELSVRQADRLGIASELDPELLELYDDLRRTKKGVGAAAMVDGVCQGCHEQLSSVQLDKLKRSSGIKRCEHCRRILVF
jgi:predicted  nucleic acid-binding Zn-ribbon protein